MPAGAVPGGAGGSRPGPPPSVSLAVKLIYVGAVLSLLGLIATVTLMGQMRQKVEDASPDLSHAQVDTAVHIGMISGIVGGIIGILIWIGMAIVIGRGKNWARIVAVVLTVINVLGTIFNLTQHNSLFANIVQIISAVLAIVITVLLFRPDAKPFFAANGYAP